MKITMAQWKVRCLIHSLSCQPRLKFADQNFGVDLEARARADRKRVPILVTTILTFLDDRKNHLSRW